MQDQEQNITSERRINHTQDPTLIHSKDKIKQVDNNDEQVEVSSSKSSKSTKSKWIKIGLIAGALIILVIVLPATLTRKKKTFQPFPGAVPNPPPTPLPNSVFNHYSVGASNSNQDTYSGYIISNSQFDTQYNPEIFTNRQARRLNSNDNHNLGINARSLPIGPNNQFINNVSFFFCMPDYKIAYLEMTDALNARYKVPNTVGSLPCNSAMRLEMLGFQMKSSPFSFSFTDVTDPTNVFVHTDQSSLVFMDKYIQLDFQLPSQKVYGLGERIHEFTLGEGTWTIWTKGLDSPYDDGTGGKQVYGAHPFALIQGKNKGDYFGIWFRNSNAQSPLLKFNEDGTSTLSYITNGGRIEVYFFIHGSAKEIIQKYQNIIGNPNLPPFWSLGWSQGSWKYTNQQMFEEMINNYKEASMPLEVIYLDVPYMKNNVDFTVDAVAFPDLPSFIKNLQSNNQKLVLIIDAPLTAEDENNEYYKLAQEKNILIQSSIHSDQYNGALIQNMLSQKSVYIDWFHQDAQGVWNQGLSDLYNQLPYDGLWIDMNEAAGACDGECPDYTAPQSQFSKRYNKIRNLEENQINLLEDSDPDTNWYSSVLDQSVSSTYNLPFYPGYAPLDNMALSLNATHPSNGELEYNLHNLYGHMMAQATNSFLTEKVFQNSDNRPFILTRSSFSGTGSYASHWLGDNWREWNYLKYSIAGIMNMNMFGIPHVGADVCGFFGEKRDDEMCARWIQLSTFYPLARANQNQSFYGEPSDFSEAYTLAEPWKTKAKSSLFDRYQYLRHLYTCLFEVSQWGGSCIDPLFFYFPDDDNTYNEPESTFMVGGAIKVTPILQQGVAVGGNFSSYFPAGQWVNLADYSLIVTGGQMVSLTEQDTVNAHLRPGSIIAKQDNSEQNIFTTSDLLKVPISLIVNRDTNGMAEGSLFLDKGISRSEILNSSYEYYNFKVSSNSINKLFVAGTRGAQKTIMNKIVITNAADLQQVNFACYMDYSFKPTALNIQKDSKTKTLTLTAMEGNSVNFQDWKTIHYGNSLSDLDLCNPATYTYKLKSGKLPDLSGSQTSFIISSMTSSIALPDVKVTLKMLTPNIVNIFWTFNSQPFGQRTPFQVPKTIVNPTETKDPSSLSNFVFIQDQPFIITIKSVSQDTVLDIDGEIYHSWINLLKIKAYMQSGDKFSGIFGLGERVQTDLPYLDGVYSMYSRDAGTPTDTGNVPGANVYGTFPFYLFRSGQGIWTGVYHNLPQAQDWYFQNDREQGEVDLTSISIGGVVDIYIILGYNPKQVVSNYWKYIVGTPVLIPQYALGWNQCRWGYKTTKDLIDVVGNYSAQGIPLDVQWSDIDYLDNYRDFTYDKDRFADLPNFIQSLHEKNMYYVPIIDAGIAMRPNANYSSYDSGISKNIFIKANSNDQKTSFVGNVWPNEAVYPDWFNPQTGTWWQDQLQNLHDQIAFDGLWLDMNEASNFCNGPCLRQQKSSSSVLQYLKYIPTNRDLNIKSINVDAFHNGNVLEIDAHSLFGTEETMYSSQWLQSKGKRPFIIERSSFAGMGKYGSRWLGDNSADIQHLESSITGIMMMGIFGIPFNGVDICGFGGNTTAELCARWTVVGAFYPFSRNHNDYNSNSQEPYAFANEYYEEGVSYMSIMKQGILNKYHLIKYYYTQIYLGSQYAIGPFFNPMWLTFGDDPNSFSDPQYNIMLGSSLKLSVLTDKLGQNNTEFYFPKGVWCNLYKPTDHCMNLEQDAFVPLQTKAFDFYVHLYSGNIVPMQDATSLQITKVHDLLQYPIDLHILGSEKIFGTSWYAQGSYVNDDGMTTTLTGNVNQYAISAMATTANPQKITIAITMYYSAFNYKNQDNCNAVNSNDYLGNIYLYNADHLGIVSLYLATIYYNDGATEVVIGNAQYDEDTDRVIYKSGVTKDNLDNRFCLTRISKIIFSNLN